MWLLVFCFSSSRCHWLVCGLCFRMNGCLFKKFAQMRYILFVAVFPGYNQHRPGELMVIVVLCPETHECSTGSCSGFKASQKTGPQLKVSFDRLGEAGNRTFDPWFTRHRFIPFTTAAINTKISCASTCGSPSCSSVFDTRF